MGTQTADSNALALTLSANSPFGIQGGTLLLTAASNSPLNAGETTSFTFVVINPSSLMFGAEVYLTALYTHLNQMGATTQRQITSSLMDSPRMLIPYVLRAKVGDAHPLYINNPVFVVSEIGQSTTYPNAANVVMLTFTLFRGCLYI